MCFLQTLTLEKVAALRSTLAGGPNFSLGKSIWSSSALWQVFQTFYFIFFLFLKVSSELEAKSSAPISVPNKLGDQQTSNIL